MSSRSLRLACPLLVAISALALAQAGDDPGSNAPNGRAARHLPPHPEAPANRALMSQRALAIGPSPNAAGATADIPAHIPAHRPLRRPPHPPHNPQTSQLNLAPVVSYSSDGFYPESLAVADVNGDGRADLVMTNECADHPATCSDGGAVSVLLGNGNGTFQTAVTYGSGGDYADSVALTDVNGDGYPDIVVANQCAPTGNCDDDAIVSVLLANGDGTFQTAVSYDSGGAYAYSVAVTDVNNDGNPDIVVANWCESSGNCVDDAVVSVLLGNGDGTFQAAVIYDSGGEYGASVTVADVNNDGNPDIVVANWCASGDGACASSGAGAGVVAVLLGNGDGTFQTVTAYSTGAASADSVTAADVDGDGNLDLVVANWCASPGNCDSDAAVSVLLGNGDGTFQPATTYDSGGQYANSVAASDMDGDGIPDLVIANWCPSPGDCSGYSVASVLLGNGDGTFQPAFSYDSGGYGPYFTTAADVNADKKPDVLVANACVDSACVIGTVGVLINNSVGAATIKLVSLQNPSLLGQPVSFTATMRPRSFRVSPSGTVSFFDGTTSLGSAPVTAGTNASGAATFTTSALGQGQHSITAIYGGDANFTAVTSTVAKQVVDTVRPFPPPYHICWQHRCVGHAGRD